MVNVSVDEMKVSFFAIIISFGLVKKPDIESYWKTDEIMSIPFYSKYIARDRFLLILSYLHLVDNDLHMNENDPELVIIDRNYADDNPIFKPRCIADYCKLMGGVDLIDQVVQYYSVLRKTVKW
ncbi:hypothetical protein KUTeg_006072 [Tegillarca granosa]|uniref:PiggyBac transposable element-derived protein domain-containing protein n=1 Tax=Tegillarca granosa TaxID=220873 RepID=A0ABQ9FFE5_TEGGR|nr:hypothetical protein KUTeg_006072 [Tegillarca granosa]